MRSARQGKTHLAAGAVGNAAHRVNRLKGGAGGNQHALARQQFGLKKRDYVVQQFLGLAHAAIARFAAGLVAHAHTQHGGAVGTQLRHIAHSGGVRPHFAVHGRGQQQRHRFDGAGQAHQAEQIVSAPVQQFGHEIGAARSNKNGVGLSAQVDVRHIVGLARVPLRGVDAALAQGLQGDRGDELGCGLGHHHLHGGAFLDERAAQFGGLVARNAAAESQNNVFTA